MWLILNRNPRVFPRITRKNIWKQLYGAFIQLSKHIQSNVQWIAQQVVSHHHLRPLSLISDLLWLVHLLGSHCGLAPQMAQWPGSCQGLLLTLTLLSPLLPITRRAMNELSLINLIHFDLVGKIKLSMRGQKCVLSMPASLRELSWNVPFSVEKNRKSLLHWREWESFVSWELGWFIDWRRECCLMPEELSWKVAWGESLRFSLYLKK
jgi:hypothetical protein